jgi:D-3-phosphoglycerate dehydrogenase
MTEPTDGARYLLVAPHSFPSMALEEQVAASAGIPLAVSADVDDFRTRLPGARAVLIGTRGTIDAEAISRLTGCLAIVRYGVGLDNVDVPAATAHWIPVANVPDAATEEVATHALGLALALLRRLREADRSIRDGDWLPGMMSGVRRLSSVTVGVVGVGRIGQLIAQMFTGLGARVIVHDPYAAPTGHEVVPLADLLRQADIISLHVPLTAETRRMISSATLLTMRPGAVLVNVSRGGLVDEPAVAAALRESRLGALGMDVFDTEPLPADSPLRDAPRTILTPHVAWRSEESLAAYQQRACEQVGLALRGERMPAAVNPQVYDGRSG